MIEPRSSAVQSGCQKQRGRAPKNVIFQGANVRLLTSRGRSARREETSFFLASIQLSTGIQMVVVEKRVEDQEIASNRRSTVNRIVGI